MTPIGASGNFSFLLFFLVLPPLLQSQNGSYRNSNFGMGFLPNMHKNSGEKIKFHLAQLNYIIIDCCLGSVKCGGYVR